MSEPVKIQPLQFDVVTLFPQMFEAVSKSGITARALERKIYELAFWNPRDFTTDNYKTVDDRPYGGGPGMVMLAEPLEKAIAAAKQRQSQAGVERPRVIHLSPAGKTLTHEAVMQLAAEPGLVLLASRYEGVDERLLASVVDEEYSIGDYVLSGGELPAMVLIDAIVRLMDTPDEFVGPVNVGSPEEFTILELAQMTIRLTGSRSRIVFAAQPQDDPKQRRPDIGLARRVLQWAPTVALADGLMRTIEYFDRQLRGKAASSAAAPPAKSAAPAPS